jgi:hypothetical protein
VRKTPDAKTDGAGWLGVFNRHHTRKAVRIPFEAIGFEKGRGPGRLKSLWDSRELDGPPSAGSRNRGERRGLHTATKELENLTVLLQVGSESS